MKSYVKDENEEYLEACCLYGMEIPFCISESCSGKTSHNRQELVSGSEILFISCVACLSY